MLTLLIKISIVFVLFEENSIPTLEEQLALKLYVDQAVSDCVDESSLLGLDEKLNLVEQHSIFLISTLTLPKTMIELPTKSCVDNKFNDPSIIKNTAYVNFTDKNLDNVRFVKINSLPAVREHLTPKFFVEQAFFIR